MPHPENPCPHPGFGDPSWETADLGHMTQQVHTDRESEARAAPVTL